MRHALVAPLQLVSDRSENRFDEDSLTLGQRSVGQVGHG